MNTAMSKTGPDLPTDMAQAIESCHERCEAIVDAFASKVEALEGPSTVFHYTNGPGLFGILESGRVWLTDMFDLNDPSELHHGVKYACDILTAAAQTAHPAAELFARKFSAVMSSGIEAVGHFFVACFSRNGDELGQWRAYGDDGRGFALGFDGRLLEERFTVRNGEPIPTNATFPITYDDSALRAVHQQLVHEVLPLIAMPAGRSLESGAINEFMRELSISLSLSAVRAAIFFKHEGYRNEEEHRFLQLRSAHAAVDDLKHRVRRYSLVRFSDFDWRAKDRQILREVVIGPAADEAAARSFARECLQACGLEPEQVTVRRSKIPYRGA